MEKIKNFNTENEIIAPFHGKYFKLNEDETVQAQDVTNKDMIKACGVGSYKKNIYSFGNHSKFYKKFNVNFIKDNDMFFVSIGKHTSTNRIFKDGDIKNYNINGLLYA